VSGPDPPPARGAGVAGLLTTSCGAVHFVRAGAGPPLVLLHDLARDLHSCDPLRPALVAQHHLVAVDLLGHGKSAASSDLSVPAQAEALGEVLRDLRLGDVVLVGHALGGSVAIETAASTPRQVRKLVLLGAGAYHYPALWRLLRLRPVWSVLGALGRPGLRARALDVIRSPPRNRGEAEPGDRRAIERNRWRTLGRAFRQSSSHNALARMEELVEHSLAHPTLVIWGSDDHLVPASAARVLFRGRPNVRFVEVAGAGHAVHEEEPGVVAELIIEFLR